MNTLVWALQEAWAAGRAPPQDSNHLKLTDLQWRQGRGEIPSRI